jgi:hypothetical protein
MKFRRNEMALVCAGGDFIVRGAGDCVDEPRREARETGTEFQRADAKQRADALAATGRLG